VIVSCLVTNDWVARFRLLVIPAGDGVPSTHTALEAAPDRAVTDDHHNGAPFPFAAIQPGSGAVRFVPATTRTPGPDAHERIPMCRDATDDPQPVHLEYRGLGR
jgi:hypothetical protein